jgi:hypothetical protein
LDPAGTIRGQIQTPANVQREGYRLFVYEYVTVDGGYYVLLTNYDVLTDNEGFYEISGLTPDDYVIAARPAQKLPYDQSEDRYYPGVVERGLALTVTVEAGQVVEGIDIPFSHPPGARLPFVRLGSHPSE